MLTKTNFSGSQGRNLTKTTDDLPPDPSDDDNNVVNLNKKRREEAFKVEMEDLATRLAQATQVACVKKDSTFFGSSYLINGYLQLTEYAKSNLLIADRLRNIKTAIGKHNDPNCKLVFEAELSTAHLALQAEKQRRLQKLREDQKTITFNDYELDKYAAYNQQSGLPVADLFNAQLALKHLGVVGRYNVYKEEQTALYEGQPADLQVLWNLIQAKTRVQWPVKHLETALDLYCKRQSYHPIIDYFDSIRHLEYKGIIDTWMTVCLGAEDTPLNRAIGKKMIVATVARTYKPGTKFDQMVVWEGPQGTGKSSLLEMLCGSENFNSGKILEEDNMKVAEALKGRMLYESAELVGHSRDIDKLKSMLSKTSDKGRWAYDRKVRDHPRTAIIVGTTNRREYLIDETGNRRFWPVSCGVVPTANMIDGKPYIDFKWMEKNRDQLYAEALHLYEEGYSLVLDESLWPEVAKLQDARMTEVSGVEKIGYILSLSETEGLNITENEAHEMIELRIHTNKIIEFLFAAMHGNASQGRMIKQAMESYRHLEYGLRWEYAGVQRIKGIPNSTYIMKAKGEAYKYLKALIETYRADRRQAGIDATEKAM